MNLRAVENRGVSIDLLGGLTNTGDYQIARFLIERGLGAIYFIAFVVAALQFPALSGERGLDPAPDLLNQVRFPQAPSLFHWRYSDNFLRAVAITGAVLSAAIVLGLVPALPLPLT